MFLYEEPQVTGTILFAIVPTLKPFLISSCVNSSPSRYFIINSSSCSATASIIFSWYSFAKSTISAGISSSTTSFPKSSLWTNALILIRSTIPWKLSSAPIGNWTGTALAFNLFFNWSTQSMKFAPVISILFTYTILGTLYLSACLQTVSVCGWTPPFAAKIVTAPSSTFKDLWTSTVKSTWPGVSMMFILCPNHWHVVAAEVIVIPLSCSWTIQSIVASPSWTSPILWVLPV